MNVSSIGSSVGLSAMAAGLRGRMETTHLQTVLEAGGLLDPALAEALAMTGETAEAITAAGAEIAQLEMMGTIVDLVA